jgi:hypothetical protein
MTITFTIKAEVYYIYIIHRKYQKTQQHDIMYQYIYIYIIDYEL